MNSVCHIAIIFIVSIKSINSSVLSLPLFAHVPVKPPARLYITVSYGTNYRLAH